MPELQDDHALLESAISDAISVYALAVPTPEFIAGERLVKSISSELATGHAVMGGPPLVEDIQAYLFALMATKVIAANSSNYDREAAIRLLYAAIDAIDQYRWAEEEVAGDES